MLRHDPEIMPSEIDAESDDGRFIQTGVYQRAVKRRPQRPGRDYVTREWLERARQELVSVITSAATPTTDGEATKDDFLVDQGDGQKYWRFKPELEVFKFEKARDAFSAIDWLDQIPIPAEYHWEASEDLRAAVMLGRCLERIGVRDIEDLAQSGRVVREANRERASNSPLTDDGWVIVYDYMATKINKAKTKGERLNQLAAANDAIEKIKTRELPRLKGHHYTDHPFDVRGTTVVKYYQRHRRTLRRNKQPTG